MKIAENKKATEYLANERTFLAWMRTCISVIGLGFVVAKFGIWLRELALGLTPVTPLPSMGMSLPIGVGIMAVGGLFAVLAAGHYHRVCIAIEKGEVRANKGLILTATLFVSLLAILMIAYMLITAT